MKRRKKKTFEMKTEDAIDFVCQFLWKISAAPEIQFYEIYYYADYQAYVVEMKKN